MSSTRVSVLLPPAGRTAEELTSAAERIGKYLETTGFTFEILTPEGDSAGAVLRRGVSDAKGSVVVIADPDLPYPVSAIGDAVAMIDSGNTDVVFGCTRAVDRRFRLLRWLLVPLLPDPALQLKAFSNVAAKVVVGESRLNDGNCELELAFLTNKYGFRIERLVVERRSRTSTPMWSAAGGIAPAIRIRYANRNNAYRAPRRCPVCFSGEVWSRGQIPGNVVRACNRCKCRYLNQFIDDDSTTPRRVLRSLPPGGAPSYEAHSHAARERTSARRLAWVRRQLPSRARILEVGVRDGSFGSIAASEYEYVGIDPASAAARHSRARGLEVYCASLSSFVNTGPAFDALTLFHVFENMADPHDALGRIKDLIKPGGMLFLSAFDTEGMIYLFTERKRMAQNFRTHLILYSRSALIELLEHSGFEIIDIGPDFEYRDHKFVRHWLASHHPRLAPLMRFFLRFLPDPLIVSSGAIRIIAKRRAGASVNARAIRSVEPTHAR
ncbi:MAG TPA: bifunctional glycosyltransferase/class I SAM-dependent methyltransferase [Thermoanaerobaculia bacterium]|nr:bifunctional glycosyltransferase/class I SAM-dependent methyltransferase [Thermoanaerobaculia bacterium]